MKLTFQRNSSCEHCGEMSYGFFAKTGGTQYCAACADANGDVTDEQYKKAMKIIDRIDAAVKSVITNVVGNTTTL